MGCIIKIKIKSSIKTQFLLFFCLCTLIQHLVADLYSCEKCILECSQLYRDTNQDHLCPRCLAICNKNDEMMIQTLTSFFRSHKCCPVDTKIERFHFLMNSFFGVSRQLDSSLRKCGAVYNPSTFAYQTQSLVYKCLEFIQDNGYSSINEKNDENKDELEEIFEKNKQRFIGSNDFPKIEKSLKNQNRSPTTRGQMMEFGMRLCQVKRKVTRPIVAEHHSGVVVPLLIKNNLRQYFFETSCESETPLINTNPPGICKNVKGMHKAIFVVDEMKYIRNRDKFGGCQLVRSRSNPNTIKRYICDDWIQLRGSCALYV